MATTTTGYSGAKMATTVFSSPMEATGGIHREGNWGDFWMMRIWEAALETAGFLRWSPFSLPNTEKTPFLYLDDLLLIITKWKSWTLEFVKCLLGYRAVLHVCLDIVSKVFSGAYTQFMSLGLQPFNPILSGPWILQSATVCPRVTMWRLIHYSEDWTNQYKWPKAPHRQHLPAEPSLHSLKSP